MSGGINSSSGGTIGGLGSGYPPNGYAPVIKAKNA